MSSLKGPERFFYDKTSYTGGLTMGSGGRNGTNEKVEPYLNSHGHGSVQFVVCSEAYGGFKGVRVKVSAKLKCFWTTSY